jgi:hypothetical protein
MYIVALQLGNSSKNFSKYVLADCNGKKIFFNFKENLLLLAMETVLSTAMIHLPVI